MITGLRITGSWSTLSATLHEVISQPLLYIWTLRLSLGHHAQPWPSTLKKSSGARFGSQNCIQLN
ncbi:hypothetical protein HCEG_03936 [Histoplasma capsulatum var. duboisii H88]|uniref:Uncharacterized protein n=1 Tax=Ajellomyces capsulatus (strain H88) TaxID=544711 RepID=F0UEJ1_AJEC8|nr:hypothetical protein HCEG_03936 [Histoplasma capsulatum var. duboisii H88]QSS55497.1 hypothetical protein I7I53_03387 [Histoplasma capsulatum var. duboisii H88]